MPVSSSLRRLLRIRELEEEQSRLALETAISELNQVEAALEAAAERAKSGREIVAASVHSSSLTERIAGLEEIRAGGSYRDTLTIRLARAEQQVAQLRERFLSTRVQRRQAETIIDKSSSRADSEEARRSQQDLDDWHRSR